MNISKSDQRFSDCLKGKRLICEVPFDLQEIEEMKQILIPLGAEAAWKFPAVAAVMMVGMGIYFYHEKDLWSVFQSLGVLFPAACGV